MFVSSIAFSITVSSLWPFLQIVTETRTSIARIALLCLDRQEGRSYLSRLARCLVLHWPIDCLARHRLHRQSHRQEQSSSRAQHGTHCRVEYPLRLRTKSKQRHGVEQMVDHAGSVHYGHGRRYVRALQSSNACLRSHLANSTIMRSYASSATTLAERTNVMANLSAFQGVGFILGPRNCHPH